MAAVVGIVDFHGQTHCMEHASTVSSYESEIRSTDPAQTCWCGAKVGGRKKRTPSITMQYRNMNDGIKGERAPARRLVAKGGKR